MSDAITWRVGAGTAAGRAPVWGDDTAFVRVFSAGDPTSRTVVLAVADGVGGTPGARDASNYATSTIRLVLGDYVGLVNGRVDWQEAMHDAFACVESELAALAGIAPERRRMATTLTCAVVTDGHLIVGHAGDSRAYLFRDGALRLLTADHNEAADLVTDGRLSPADAQRHPSRNVVTRFLSPTRSEAPDVDVVTIAAGDIVLLCTDGLYTRVPPAEIAAVLAGIDRTAGDDYALFPVADALVALAIARGGTDDVGVALAVSLP